MNECALNNLLLSEDRDSSVSSNKKSNKEKKGNKETHTKERARTASEFFTAQLASSGTVSKRRERLKKKKSRSHVRVGLT